MTKSQSSMPASTRTEGCAALPRTVRRSRRSWRLRRRALSMSTIVMSFASDTRLSATVEPTCPAPRITIFTIRCGLSSVFFPTRVYTQCLQLAVQVGAFQAALLRDPRDRTVLEREVVLEVSALERLARVAQWQVERQVDALRR